MLNVLADLRLSQSRTASTWLEVQRIFHRLEWVRIPRPEERHMAYSVLESDGGKVRPCGRMLALVMMQDTYAPELAWPSGSAIFGIRGNLTIVEDGEEKLMEPWSLAFLGGSRQVPSCAGLYLGLWGFPQDRILEQMLERARG